ncbi:MAG: trypsin-like serine protease [Proteobacteria bacterium]|nr:trypsin-like serine protease [Pseudomonadota bacterium]
MKFTLQVYNLMPMAAHSMAIALMVSCSPSENHSRVKIDNGVYIEESTANKVDGTFSTMTKTPGASSGGGCTGTAVSTNTAMTAAHCVYSSGRNVDGYFAISGKEYCVSNSVYKKVCSNKIYLHPRYPADSEDSELGYDVAFVVFPEGTFKSYFEIATEGPKVGDQVLLLGYSEGNMTEQGKGSKRFGYTSVSQIKAASQNDIVSSGRGTFTGVAVSPGDSGGPLFLGCKISGVASRMGITGSSKVSLHTNLTSTGNQAFLKESAAKVGGYICGLSGNDSKYCPPQVKFSLDQSKWGKKEEFPCNYNGTSDQTPQTDGNNSFSLFAAVDGDRNSPIVYASASDLSLATLSACVGESAEAAKGCGNTIAATKVNSSYFEIKPTPNGSAPIFIHLKTAKGDRTIKIQPKS